MIEGDVNDGTMGLGLTITENYSKIRILKGLFRLYNKNIWTLLPGYFTAHMLGGWVSKYFSMAKDER